MAHVATAVFQSAVSVLPRIHDSRVSSASLPIAVSDGATRMFLISQLVMQLERADQQSLARFVDAGFTPDLVDRLRNLSIADAIRFASGYCGFSIQVDCQALQQQLSNVERGREDRSLYEYFIRHGASPGLTARLFGVSHTDVRRLRKLICPDVCAGGRPRLPEEGTRSEVRQVWADLASEASEKRRYWELSRRFPGILIVALETVTGSDDEAWPGATTTTFPARLPGLGGNVFSTRTNSAALV